MRFVTVVFAVICAAFLLPVCCYADAVFRSEGVTDLSAVRSLVPDLKQLTVLQPPDPNQGQLICSGAELSAFDTIEKDELQSLVFVPFCEDVFCRISLLTQGETEPISITVTNSDCAVLGYSIEAGQYCWAWAQNNYFSHISDAV